MQNVLHSLYNGKIIPWERKSPLNEKQIELMQKIKTAEQYFTEKLSDDDLKKWDELCNLRCEFLSDEEEKTFSYGFTFGMLLTLDISEQAKLITGK